MVVVNQISNDSPQTPCLVFHALLRSGKPPITLYWVRSAEACRELPAEHNSRVVNTGMARDLADRFDLLS